MPQNRADENREVTIQPDATYVLQTNFIMIALVGFAHLAAIAIGTWFALVMLPVGVGVTYAVARKPGVRMAISRGDGVRFDGYLVRRSVPIEDVRFISCLAAPESVAVGLVDGRSLFFQTGATVVRTRLAEQVTRERLQALQLALGGTGIDVVAERRLRPQRPERGAALTREWVGPTRLVIWAVLGYLAFFVPIFVARAMS